MRDSFRSPKFFLFFFFFLIFSSFSLADVCDEDYYGEMWNYTGDGFTFSFGATGIYYNATGFVSHILNGFNFTCASQAEGGCYLTANNAGNYSVNAHMTGKGSAAGGEYGISVAKNFLHTESRECYTRKTGTGDTDQMSITCLLELQPGDTLNMKVEDESNPTKDITIYSATLTAVSVCSENNDDYSWMYLLGLLFFVGLYLVGRLAEDRTFVVLSGFWIIFYAIGIYRLGYPGFNDFMLNGFVIVLVGIGAWLLLMPFFEDKFGMED